MTTSRRSLRLPALVIACAVAGLAQGVGPQPRKVFAQSWKIETSYDQTKDTTTVGLAPMQVYGEPLGSAKYMGGDEARFYASFTYHGQALSARPERVLVSLISTSGDWKYTDFRKLTASVDGKRLKLGPLVRAPSFTVSAPSDLSVNDSTRQEIAVSLPYGTFLRIANGKKVRIRMGPREFRLEESHLEALRDLVSRMAP
jgi:hypothetical protein